MFTSDPETNNQRTVYGPVSHKERESVLEQSLKKYLFANVNSLRSFSRKPKLDKHTFTTVISQMKV